MPLTKRAITTFELFKNIFIDSVHISLIQEINQVKMCFLVVSPKCFPFSIYLTVASIVGSVIDDL